MRYGFILFLLLNILSIAQCNDSSVEGAGGSWRPVKGEHPTVQMVKEDIHIDVYQKDYQTVVNFEFFNDGPATNAKMGFPESAYSGGPPKKSSFISFVTSIDGKPTVAQRVITSLNTMGTDDDGKPYVAGFSALWIKDVPFAAKQRRKVQVVYRSYLGGAAAEGPNRFAPYDFTGGNWRGLVEESTLTVVLHEPGYYLVRAEVPGKPTQSQNGAQFDFKWKNWQAQGSFNFWLAKTDPNWMTLPGTLQFYDGKERTDAEIISLLKIAKVEGKESPTLDWAPPFLMRDDVLFAHLESLPNVISDQSLKRKQFREVSAFSTRVTGAIRVGEQRLNFWTDQQSMQVKGKGAVNLPAKPFSLDSNFYVPLEPVIKALGGSLNVNKSARRVYFTVP